MRHEAVELQVTIEAGANVVETALFELDKLVGNEGEDEIVHHAVGRRNINQQRPVCVAAPVAAQ